MTTKEIEKILHAYNEGKNLEYRYLMDHVEPVSWATWKVFNGDDDKLLSWLNDSRIEFRVEQESKYRPYNSAKEFLEASKEHGPYLEQDGTYEIPKLVLDNYIVWNDDNSCYYIDLMIYYTWQDGTICGVIE